jgi:hypothetical protein
MARLRVSPIRRPWSRSSLPGAGLSGAPFLVLVAIALVGMAGRRWF